MHKPMIATLVVLTFGAGYVVGQTGGATASLAAAKKHATTTKKLNPAARTTRKNAAGSSAQHADGQITAISGNTITVKPDADKAGSNEYTAVTAIVLNGSTTYDAGHGNAATTTKPTISVGQYIVAEGALSDGGKTLTATLVSVHTGGPGHGGPGRASGPHADGTVTAVNGDTITIKADADRAGTNEYTAVTTIKLTSTTQFGGGHDSAATTTRPTITAGENIVAEGVLGSGGTTLTATRVSVRSGGTTGP